jgi:hypothetical protein
VLYGPAVVAIAVIMEKADVLMTCSYWQHLLVELVKAATAMASSPSCRSGELHFTSTHKETR